ncbi:sigma 54-interacting transcriptional regulator [candidate division KSB1 bacterium]|nr:sigma 54-interacting transcriptional regulator [candidate division KSB1 bacterium]
MNKPKTKNNKSIECIPAAYQQLIELGKRLLTESDINRLLTMAMDAAIEISRAERGLIILFNENSSIQFQTARSLNKEDIEHPQFEISRSIIDKVRNHGSPINLQNALVDPEFQKRKSVDELKILSVVCLPLKHNQKIFGVVYLDNRSVPGIFDQETYLFVNEFANFISLAAHCALERKRLINRINVLESELRIKYDFKSIIGQHPKMLEILQLISQVADTDATVLIQGESGTGKELIARALHFNSRRKEKAFIPVNCAALPEQLLESELFGHIRGAFTGAIKDKAGWFERADEGTIFLDEVNDMSPALQARLLRILQTGDYSRVGATEIRKCDVRVVAATCKPLRELVKSGTFREELFYRLNVVDICLPPLRERKSDILLLVQHFLKIYANKNGKPYLKLSPEIENLLLNYDFPGNIRELENIIQRAVIFATGSMIEPQHIPLNIKNNGQERILSTNLQQARRQAIETAEKEIITNYLNYASGHISKAAKLADVDVSNFHKLIKKYDIDPHQFK